MRMGLNDKGVKAGKIYQVPFPQVILLLSHLLMGVSCWIGFNVLFILQYSNTQGYLLYLCCQYYLGPYNLCNCCFFHYTPPPVN